MGCAVKSMTMECIRGRGATTRVRPYYDDAPPLQPSRHHSKGVPLWSPPRTTIGFISWLFFLPCYHHHLYLIQLNLASPPIARRSTPDMFHRESHLLKKPGKLGWHIIMLFDMHQLLALGQIPFLVRVFNHRDRIETTRFNI